MKGKILLGLFCLALVLGLPSFRHTGVQAQTTSHGVTLTWTAGTNDAAYNVYRSLTTGGPYSQIATGVSALTYKDSTGIPGTKYFYVVTGTAPGFLESANSNEVSATFLQQAGAPALTGATAN